jgi:hypothetical protein
MDLVIFALAFESVIAALACWIAYQLARQNGRILLKDPARAA